MAQGPRRRETAAQAYQRVNDMRAPCRGLERITEAVNRLCTPAWSAKGVKEEREASSSFTFFTSFTGVAGAWIDHFFHAA